MPLAAQSPAAWQRPATAAMLPLLLVFLAGVSVGALAMSFHRASHGTRTETVHQLTLQKWKKELGLSDDQSRQIETVLDDFSKYYDNVLADGNSRILQILDQRQKQKFERMLKEHR